MERSGNPLLFSFFVLYEDTPLSRPFSSLMSEYAGTTVPQIDDKTDDLLRKLLRILNDSATGVLPLPVEASVTIGDVTLGSVTLKDGVGATLGTIGANGLEVNVKASALPSGGASSALQTSVGATNHADLLAILAKMIAAPATEASLAAVLAKLADPATQATLAAVLAKLPAVPATDTTLALINAKIPAAPSTAALQTSGNASLTALQTKVVDGVVSINSDQLLDAGAAAKASSTAVEASRVIKASQGTLVALFITNEGPAQYIQLHDAASLPANGAVPALSMRVPSNVSIAIDIPICGIPFGAGIVFCNSSTLATKTLGSANCFITAIYI